MGSVMKGATHINFLWWWTVHMVSILIVRLNVMGFYVCHMPKAETITAYSKRHISRNVHRNSYQPAGNSDQLAMEILISAKNESQHIRNLESVISQGIFGFTQESNWYPHHTLMEKRNWWCHTEIANLTVRQHRTQQSANCRDTILLWHPWIDS